MGIIADSHWLVLKKITKGETETVISDKRMGLERKERVLGNIGCSLIAFSTFAAFVKVCAINVMRLGTLIGTIAIIIELAVFATLVIGIFIGGYLIREMIDSGKDKTEG